MIINTRKNPVQYGKFKRVAPGDKIPNVALSAQEQADIDHYINLGYFKVVGEDTPEVVTDVDETQPTPEVVSETPAPIEVPEVVTETPAPIEVPEVNEATATLEVITEAEEAQDEPELEMVITGADADEVTEDAAYITTVPKKRTRKSNKS